MPGTITLACACCTPSTVTSPCCAGNAIPTTLRATISAGTGTCACLNGTTVFIVYDSTATPVHWRGSYIACTSSTSFFNLFCQAGNWLLSSDGSCALSATTTFLKSCADDSSFSLVFHVNFNGCCTGNATVTITH